MKTALWLKAVLQQYRQVASAYGSWATRSTQEAKESKMYPPTISRRVPADQYVGKMCGRWHRTPVARVCHSSAKLPRFIERDTLGFEAGDNNWYRFVANGTTGKTDPSGLCEESKQACDEADDFGRHCAKVKMMDVGIIGKPTVLVWDPRNPDFPASEWGHAVISTPNQTKGLYPERGNEPAWNRQTPGEIRDDSWVAWDPAYVILVTYRACPETVAIIDAWIRQKENQINAKPADVNPWGGGPNDTYSALNSNGGRNCIGFAIEAIEFAGGKPNIPSNMSPIWVPSHLPK